MRRALLALLAGCGGAEPVDVPQGVRVHDLTIGSKAVGDRLPVKAVVPEDGESRPLLVLLHGRGNEGA